MAGGINKVLLIGNLGADPELRHTSAGQAVAELRVATGRKWQAKDGTQRDETEWHRVVVWGEQAEHCAKYLAKGRQVYVEGRLQTRKWQDKEGRDRYTTEVVAQVVQFLGGRELGAGEGASSGRASSAAPPAEQRGEQGWQAEDDDDPIPF
jgi:single-strand DNA-binding protein